mmetsp:Transcript_23009/g.40658  ORF Transcript_23009/g.40658 Transcript_23009/m.40658 type:complete len:211 (-) Transcript_23009:290-922(-)
MAARVSVHLPIHLACFGNLLFRGRELRLAPRVAEEVVSSVLVKIELVAVQRIDMGVAKTRARRQTSADRHDAAGASLLHRKLFHFIGAFQIGVSTLIVVATGHLRQQQIVVLVEQLDLRHAVVDVPQENAPQSDRVRELEDEFRAWHVSAVVHEAGDCYFVGPVLGIDQHLLPCSRKVIIPNLVLGVQHHWRALAFAWPGRDKRDLDVWD